MPTRHRCSINGRRSALLRRTRTAVDAGAGDRRIVSISSRQVKSFALFFHTIVVVIVTLATLTARLVGIVWEEREAFWQAGLVGQIAAAEKECNCDRFRFKFLCSTSVPTLSAQQLIRINTLIPLLSGWLAFGLLLACSTVDRIITSARHQTSSARVALAAAGEQQ